MIYYTTRTERDSYSVPLIHRVSFLKFFRRVPLGPPKNKKTSKNGPNDFGKATSPTMTFPYCK